MTYQEVYDWIEENFPEEYDDLGEVWEELQNEWVGRNELENIIPYNDFLSTYEGSN